VGKRHATPLCLGRLSTDGPGAEPRGFCRRMLASLLRPPGSAEGPLRSPCAQPAHGFRARRRAGCTQRCPSASDGFGSLCRHRPQTARSPFSKRDCYQKCPPFGDGAPTRAKGLIERAENDRAGRATRSDRVPGATPLGPPLLPACHVTPQAHFRPSLSASRFSLNPRENRSTATEPRPGHLLQG
jgi:hypothetical protein